MTDPETGPETDPETGPVTAAFQHQAASALALGSPFMARLMAALPDRLADAPGLCRLIHSWRGPLGPEGASLPLRLAGGLHALVRSGAAPGLAACYPPYVGAGLEAALAETLRAQDGWLCDWMTHAPQTNEVGRSAVLLAAAAALTARFGLPLRLSELGASAGLNLNFDRYALQAGPIRIGGPSEVLLTPEWRGMPPDPVLPIVASRRGVDLNPLDPGRDADRLTAFVWPDQADRLARLEAALKIAARHPVPVDRGDAADWLEARLAERAGGQSGGQSGGQFGGQIGGQIGGQCHMVFHTVAHQYFPAATQARIAAAMARAGALAGPEAPLAWLGMEADDRRNGAALTLHLWPGDVRLSLGRAGFHGQWVDWRGLG